MSANRVRDIDFWRGAVLIAILIDHIPGNPLENWTPRNFGLSDSAEAFVFLSGLSVGLIYLPRAFKYGLEPVAGGCLKRALKLYGVHIALTVAALVVFGAAYWASGVPDLIQAHGRAFVFGSPGNGLLGLALLSHQLGYFNILPLYIVLMLWAPVAVALALRGPLLALTVSIGLYAAARAFGLNLPNWPEPGGWFFNPIAWQLVFTLGVVAAILWRDGFPRPAPWLVVLSAVTVAGAALIVTNEGGLAPGLRDTATAHLDVAKQDLGLARLLHFVALAYLIATATVFGRFIAPVVRGAFGNAVQSLGRNSLSVFAAGSFLSACGQAVLAAASPHTSAGVERVLGLAYTVASIIILFAVAYWIECRKAQRQRRRRTASTFARLAGAVCILFALSAAHAEEGSCPSETAAFEPNGAPAAFAKVRVGLPNDILAIGSSSTEGIGASSPANTYPARLEAELEKQTGADFDVKNAGVGGELAAKTLNRLKGALKSGWARLVIWQVGTNDAIVGVDETLFRATVQAGIAAAHAAGVPMMLVGPQFTLKTPDPVRYERFVKMVDDIGAADHVPVLSRYALMKSWSAKGAKAVSLLLSGDGLHMSDLGYRCLAHALAEALEGATEAKL